MKSNESTVEAWRNRWKTLDQSTIDFSKSPFETTEAGLLDFRGLALERTSDNPFVIRNKRIESCDFSFSKFLNCRFEDCLFVYSKLHYCEFNDSMLFNTPSPNCDWHNCTYYQSPKPPSSWEDYLKKITNSLAPELVHTVYADHFFPENFEKAVLFYHGAWNGPSVAALRALCSGLAKLAEPPPLYVLNADDCCCSCCSSHDDQLNKIEQYFGQPVGAWGETAWIINHKIVARDAFGKRNIGESLENRIRSLFEEG